MTLLLADLIYSRDCKLNLRKNVDTTAGREIIQLSILSLFLRVKTRGNQHKNPQKITVCF